MGVISNEDLYGLFNELKAEAKELLKDPDRAAELVESAEASIQQNRTLRDAAEGIPEMAAFAKSCVKGEYTAASENSVTAVLSAFLYFMERDDAIHDSIPVIGYVDDLSVFAFAKQAAKEDLAAFSGH